MTRIEEMKACAAHLGSLAEELSGGAAGMQGIFAAGGLTAAQQIVEGVARMFDELQVRAEQAKAEAEAEAEAAAATEAQATPAGESAEG